MIEIKPGGFFKLAAIDLQTGYQVVAPILIDNEGIVGAFALGRDNLIFTTKRIITVNVQGLTGKKIEYTSIPYSKIQSYSVETAGTFDRDSELTINVSTIGSLKFELQGSFDIRSLNRAISNYIL